MRCFRQSGQGRTESIPRLTRAAFDEAKRKWEASGIASYDLDLRFAGGDQQKLVHIEVRAGEVAKCLENEVPPSQKSSWDDWTVANQFAMIGEDLDKSEDPANGFHVKDNVVIMLFAEFDPQYGYPLAYNRKGAVPRLCGRNGGC